MKKIIFSSIISASILSADVSSSALTYLGNTHDYVKNNLIGASGGIGGYHIQGGKTKAFLTFENGVFFNKLRKPEVKMFTFDEKYDVGDGLLRADWLIGAFGIGVNVGYLDLSHKNMDGGYLGFGFKHKFEPLHNIEIRGNYAPFGSGDISSMADVGLSVPLFNDISLNVNYTIIEDDRKEQVSRIVSSGTSLVTTSTVNYEKDAEKIKMISAYIKIPFSI